MSSSKRFLIHAVAASLVLAGCGGTATSSPSPTAVNTMSPAPAESAAPSSPEPSEASAPTDPPSGPTSDTGTWVTAGRLQEARNATTAVLLGTGEILVVGSDYLTSWMSACGASTDGSDSVEIGDPAGTWEKTSSLSSRRDAPVVVGLPDGRALMTGGAAGESIGWSAFSSTYTFDPTSRAWTRSGLLNTARTAAASAVLPDGRVLVAGGLFMDRDSLEATRVLDSAELWDPRTGAWTRTGDLAAGRFFASAVTLADGRVLVVGGPDSRESDPHPLASAEIFDPKTETWSSAGRLSTPRRGFALVALPDGGALVAGGVTYTPAFVVTSTTERFDPVAGTWAPAADLPNPVTGAAAIALGDGGVLLAGGAGTSDTTLTTDALVFDPDTNRWSATTSLPVPRAGASPVRLADGSVVLVGGSVSPGDPADTPGCPEADATVLRYVPGG